MARSWIAPVLGAGLGAAAGQLGARTTSEIISPGSSSGYQGIIGTGASAVLGALLATKRGRRAIGVTGSSTVRDPGARTYTTKSFNRYGTGLFAGLAPVTSIPFALNSPKVIGHIANTTDAAFDIKNKIQPVVNDLADKYDSYRDYIADPRNIGRDVGLSVGGGVAGYMGGGLLGKLVGHLVAPDDKNASYEKRRRAEKIRDVMKTLGAAGLSTVGALAAPWAYHQLPAAPTPALGGYVPAAAQPVEKPYVPVPSPKHATVNQPDTNGPEVAVPKAPGWPKRNIPFGDGHGAGGWPFSASNAWIMAGTGGQPELFSSGHVIHQKVAEALAKIAVITGGAATAPFKSLPQGAQFVDWTNADPKTKAAVVDPEAFEAERQKMHSEFKAKTASVIDRALAKLAAEHEPALAEHGSAPEHQLRSRAEVIVRDADGQIYAIDKGDYILFPGGGIDDGEHPEHTAVREVLEELGHNIVNLSQGPVVESIWPAGHPLTKDTPFKGERSHFFVALDAGEAGMPHADLEQFKTVHPQTLIDRLQELMDDPKNDWAKANNKARLLMIGHAGASGISDAPMKLAAAAGGPVPLNPNQQFVQQLAGKLQGQVAAKAPAAPAAAPTNNPANPATVTPAAMAVPTSPAPGAATPAGPSVFQPSAAPAAAPAQQPLVNTASLKQTPSQLKHSHVVEMMATLIEKFGQEADLDGLEQPDLLGAGVENNLTPRPMALNKNVEGNIHGLPQAAQQIGFAQSDVKAKTSFEPPKLTDQTKVADAVRVLPKKQFLLFTPDGKLVVRRLPNKRFTLPEQGEGRPAPYEQPVRFTPEGGVPDVGYHGYDVGLNIGNAAAPPEGFEALPAQDVLNDLYGGMGLSVNRPYMQLDRARGRAILRQLRKLRPATPPPAPVQTVAA